MGLPMLDAVRIDNGVFVLAGVRLKNRYLVRSLCRVVVCFAFFLVQCQPTHANSSPLLEDALKKRCGSCFCMGTGEAEA